MEAQTKHKVLLKMEVLTMALTQSEEWKANAYSVLEGARIDREVKANANHVNTVHNGSSKCGFPLDPCSDEDDKETATIRNAMLVSEQENRTYEP